MATHKHSGSLGITPLLAPLPATLAALVLACIYAYVVVYIPVAGYLSVFFVGAFSYGMAVVVKRIGLIGKCRSPGFLTVVGVYTALVGLYTSWAFFEFALLSRGDVDVDLLALLSSPGAVWDIAVMINETGWYTVFSITPSGVALWVLWGLEAIIICIGPVLMGSSGLLDELFCERCNAWCAASLEDLQFALPADGIISPELQAGNIQALETLGPKGAELDPYLQMVVKNCRTCDHTATAKLELVKPSRDEGKLTTEASDLGETNVLSRADYGSLTALAQRLRTAPEPEEAVVVHGQK